MILKRFQLITVFLSAWVLAVVLPTLFFAPGNWALLQFERIREHVSPRMQILLGIMGICLMIAIAVLGILLIRSIWRIRRKRQDDDYAIHRENPPVTWAVYVVILLLFAGLGGILWLSWQRAGVFENLMGPQRSIETPQDRGQPLSAQQPAASETRRPEMRPLSLPKWRVPLILSLLALLGLSMRYILKKKPSEEGREKPQVVQIVANAVKELERGGELSDVVLRCYRDMCKILGRKVTMTKDLTAREFRKLLIQTGIDEEGVTRLTDLFERVRYGRYDTRQNEQAEALALLKTIEEKYGRSSSET